MSKGRILLVEDDPRQRRDYAALIRDLGYDVETAETVQEAEEKIRAAALRYAVAVVDVWLQRTQASPVEDHEGGLRVLRAIRAECPETPAILITAHGDLKTGIRALNDGAFDFIFKGTTLADDLRHERKIAALSEEVDAARDTLILESDAMKRVIAEANLLAAEPGEPNVLLLGESGVGKTAIAHEIHKRSRRAAGPFVSVNCAAIPVEIAESRFFGHVKGAFTGADRRAQGLLEIADGGTLFLDEVGDLPAAIQPKLLHVVLPESTTRRFRPVGSPVEVATDVRIVAATDQPIEAASAGFRRQLLARLTDGLIRIPPLRERADDVLPLARYFLKKFEPGGLVALEPGAVQVLRAYPFPANVWELQNCVRKALRQARLEGRSAVDEDLLLRAVPELRTPETLARLSERGRDRFREPILAFLREGFRWLAPEVLRARSGAPRKPAAGEPKFQERAIATFVASLLETGASQAEVARALQVDEDTISRYLGIYRKSVLAEGEDGGA
jgi:DNA-binding NtrC family response regulator